MQSVALERLRSAVDTACADQKTGIPGATVVVIGKDGKELFAHSAGKQGITSSSPMTLENIFWIASCTKMHTGVACMQLVEQGVLKLDDSDETERLCPELKAIKVLLPDGKLEDKKTGITLRMLLSHTAGFGYSFFNERLRDWAFPAGLDEFSGRFDDMKSPLLFQPGTGWEYGVRTLSVCQASPFFLTELIDGYRLGWRGSRASDWSHFERVSAKECPPAARHQKYVHDTTSGDEGEAGPYASQGQGWCAVA